MGKYQIQVLPETKDTLYEQRETGLLHSPFHLEYVLYQAVKKGETEQVRDCIGEYLGNGVVMGRLSGNSLRQMKYWAVACISVAVHYAILGGLDETEAFNLSDEYIRHVDGLDNLENCVDYLTEKAVELTEQVKKTQKKKAHSPAVRKCLHYINVHLHEPISVQTLAEEAGISKDYLTVLFKKELGVSPHAYIIREKLEASLKLLERGDTYDTISYNFGFCSESHYITCFKKQYHKTPGDYKRELFIDVE